MVTNATAVVKSPADLAHHFFRTSGMGRLLKLHTMPFLDKNFLIIMLRLKRRQLWQVEQARAFKRSIASADAGPGTRERNNVWGS